LSICASRWRATFAGLDFGDGPGRGRQTVAAHILDPAKRRRAERHLPQSVDRLAVVDEGPAAGRTGAYAEPGDPGVLLVCI